MCETYIDILINNCEEGAYCKKCLVDTLINAVRKSESPHKKPNKFLPTDYCYNLRNKGAKKRKIFIFDSSTKLYLLVGEQYPYTGPVYSRERGKKNVICGRYINGIFYDLSECNDQSNAIESVILPINNKSLITTLKHQYEEGGSRERITNEPKRNMSLRKECLEANGYSCFVCGFNFEQEYGELGKGFIHVHHIHPLANLKGNTVETDPVNDLVPLCANCHAMVHRAANGQYNAVEALKELYELQHGK